MTAELTAPILSARGLTKAYYGNTVLSNVGIDILGGTIHALLGENGAGKSTLINLIAGNVQPDAGSIVVGGATYAAMTPTLAQANGIAVVHQELSLIPHLSVAENIALGAMPRRHGLLDYGALEAQVKGILARLELDLPPEATVGGLALGTRQLLEIGKALYRAPRLLILDEPTSSLAGVEVARLKRIMRQLKEDGIGLLFISHRLNEVLELADWVTVLKDGIRTASEPLAGASEAELVRLMVGRDPGDLFPPYRPSATPEIVLRAERLRSAALEDIDLDLRRGEILGVGGLLGQGQEELLLALFGAHAHEAERLEVQGRPLPLSSPREAIAAGIAYIPADRKVEGLHLDQPIAFNFTLAAAGRLAWHGIRRFAAERRLVADQGRQFAVRGSDLHGPAAQLSGGNQQKVAIGKWLALNPPVLLLNDPTRGIDVETKREIYLLLRRLAEQGTAILLFSSDTLELVHLADRVLVMVDGAVRRELGRAELTEETIVAAAVGAEPAQVSAMGRS